MARRSTLMPVLAAIALLGLPPGALAATNSTEADSPIADQGSSFHYRSDITSVSPQVPGLSIQVLEFADRLLLINHTGKTVTVYGYEGEPYARVLADGTVEQNANARATYLNTSFYGDVNPPANATPTARPKWEVLDRTGQLEWHDHRIHYMAPTVPSVVKDKSKRTLVFNWRVPISVGPSRGAVDGSLYWTPEGSKAPLAVILLGVAIVLAGLAFVVVVRRRRASSGQPPAGAGAGAPPREAW